MAVDDRDPPARAVGREEPQGDPLARPLDRGDEAQARREVRGDGRGEDAPAPVQLRRVPVPAVLCDLALVEENVHELAPEVTTLHEHGAGPQLRDRPRGGPRVGERAHPPPAEPLGLVPVRGDEEGPREEVPGQGGGEVLPLKGGPDGRDHHGIDDEGEPRAIEFVRHPPDDVAGVQHSGLRGPHVEVAEDGADLGAHLLDGEGEDRVHGAGVLGGHARDRGGPVDAGGGEALQVRLDPCASPGVAPGDREGGPHRPAETGGPLKGSAGPRRTFILRPLIAAPPCGPTAATSASIGP